MEILRRNAIVVNDLEKLARITRSFQEIERTIVVTIGSWDLLHIGHLRYLNKAKAHGDILVVGVDSDRAIKPYKGEKRPIIPQGERIEMLSYQSCVDLITLVDDVNEEGKWEYALIEAVRPNVFVAVEDSYPPSQQEDIKKFCAKLVVLPRQAEQTSTSSLIQTTIKKDLLDKIKNPGRDE